VNESFMVITGMLSNGEVSGDINTDAKTSAPIVILMGMTHSEVIANTFAGARSSLESVAVIQNGTLPEQKVGNGKCW
jgi:uroporphyrin-III C-methyltransferase